MTEKHIRSISKSIIWRLVGIAVLAIVTYAYTRSLIVTTAVTLVHHAVFLVVFYLHERMWLKIKRPQSKAWRAIAKMFTYETILGNGILAIISYIFTGNLQQMTYITLTYIGIKHLIYIFNEFIWDKIRWGKKIE